MTLSAHFSIRRLRGRGVKPAAPWKIVISRKISKLATVRNRLKRQIREVLRRETEIEASQDQLVVRVLAAEKKMSYRNIREEILTLLKKA